MFGQVLDKLSTWFGQAFLLSIFFPWLIFAIANIIMVAITFTVFDPYLLRYLESEPAEKTIIIIGSLAGIGVLAYVTSPLIQVLTEILEGKYIPPLIAEVLTLGHANRLRRLVEQDRTSLRDRQRIRRLRDLAGRLGQARSIGVEGRRNRDPPAIVRAETAIQRLRQKRDLNRAIDAGELIAAHQDLLIALQRNCAEEVRLRPPALPADIASSKRLGELHAEMINELVPGAVNIANRKFALASGERARLFATGKEGELFAELKPTRLGNDAAALRSYCETRYGFEFDFFWLRFLIEIQKNDRLSASIVKAKIQLDFSILLFWLTFIFVALWFPLLTFCSGSLAALLAVAGLGPVTTTASLRLVHASYSAFAEVVRGSIDVSRFELLQALRRPLPVSTQAEKIVWEQAARLLRLDEPVDTTFKHPTS
jgi:hypothetical protein